MASAFTCFIDGDQSREQTAHFIQLHSISICRRESKTDGNSKHLGQVCNPMHLQLSGAFLIHFADQPSCAWMEANWSSSTWVMQPRMWQMPKSVWGKIEKNRADGVEHSTHRGWQWMMTFLPKRCGHTEGILTVRVKAGCLIEVFSGASGIFPLNFHTKWLW